MCCFPEATTNDSIGGNAHGFVLEIVRLPDIKWSWFLPNGSASQPGKESNHFYIASLDPNQRLGVLPDGSASQEGSEPVKSLSIEGWSLPPAGWLELQ